MREICELSVAPEQSVFVASNAVSIAQASVCANTWCRAIYAEEKPVGLLNGSLVKAWQVLSLAIHDRR